MKQVFPFKEHNNSDTIFSATTNSQFSVVQHDWDSQKAFNFLPSSPQKCCSEMWKNIFLSFRVLTEIHFRADGSTTTGSSRTSLSSTSRPFRGFANRPWTRPSSLASPAPNTFRNLRDKPVTGMIGWPKLLEASKTSKSKCWPLMSTVPVLLCSYLPHGTPSLRNSLVHFLFINANLAA